MTSIRNTTNTIGNITNTTNNITNITNTTRHTTNIINTTTSAQFLQTLFSSVFPMQQHPTLGSIFTNPVQLSCSCATTAHPRLNFYKPCSVQLFPCNNIPPSAQFLQTLFSSVVPTQQHPTLGSIFTNPVQFSCSHAATSHHV